jgi:hypothetical protein
MKITEELATLSAELSRQERLRELLYPFDEIVRVTILGFIERNVDFRDEYSFNLLAWQYSDPVFDFLLDKEQDWIAEKTIRFIAELGGKENELIEAGRFITTKDELAQEIEEAIVRAANVLLFIYNHPNPFDENFCALRMSGKRIPPDILPKIQQKLDKRQKKT